MATGTEQIRRVLTEATIENLKDLWDADRDVIPAEKVRRIKVADALVDTGATTLALPTRLIRELGLSKWPTKRTTSAPDFGARRLRNGHI